VGAFVINVALVVYLVVSKRLFGVRGGKRACEEQLREDSVIGHATEAAAAHEEPAHEAPPAPAEGPPMITEHFQGGSPKKAP
jgi:hypothetical protein